MTDACYHQRLPSDNRSTRLDGRAGMAWTTLLVISALMPFLSTVSAQDWPQWRYDANRSGATDGPGPVDAKLLWSKALPQPDPAYDHQYRMCADVTYAPVAAEGLVFIPSNVTDQVIAVDIETGVVKWRYVTEGPVRFAPVFLDGRLCFGSDDGYLCCVSAADGELLWKIRGVPETHPDSRMLAGGKLCSRWPVRGAPVSHNGVVYFGTGIWPEEGVYICAVEAELGKVLWRSDAMSYIKDGMSDHGRPYDLSLPPQGYLAIIDGKLAVPSGRSLAAWFDLETGAMEPYTCFYVKHNPPRGTWYLSGINQYWVQGGNWFGTRPDAMPALPAELEDAKSALFWSKQTPENELYVMKNRPFLRADTYILHPENRYTEPVLTATTAYQSEFVGDLKYLVPRGHTHVALPDYDRIVARDLTKPEWKSVEHKHISHGGRKVTMPKLEFPVMWELNSPLRVLIKAGDRLYAGGHDTIAAIAIPGPGEDVRIVWRAKIEGRPVEALVADGKLVVVTYKGNVYCFCNGREGEAPAEPRPETRLGRSLALSGHALLFGPGDGVRAETMATEKNCHVVAIEPDADRAADAKASLAQEGLYGHQVQVVHSDLSGMLLTPYWANLVVVESLDGFGSPERALAVALDALRPYTGTLHLAGTKDYPDSLKRLLSERPGYSLELGSAGVTVRREAPPEGADDWTHEPGGPDNCFANSDRLVKWPLGVLWYSGNIDRYFTPASHFQHERHPYPLVTRGRMFIITGQFLHAVDIYTGDYLWKAEMPMTPWIQTRNFDSRVYGRPTERNCVAADDWVYAVTGKTIHAYDAATGERRKVFDIPPEFKKQAEATIAPPQVRMYHGHRAEIQGSPEWTEVRLWNDLLLSMLGQTLVAIDRHSGEVRWTRPSTQQTTTYAIGEDTLYGLDCDVPRMGGGGADGEGSGRLFALDPDDGAIIWEKRLEYAPVPKHNVTNSRIWLRPIVPVLSYNANHGLIVLTVNRKSVHVFQAADGSPVWSKTNAAQGDLQRVYPPAVTDDYLLLSDYKGCYGYLFDIRTGKEVGNTTGIPRPRTCARIIGNNHLLVYRDAATEIYDIDTNRIIGLNSLRSGCTTSFIPAGGVMTAPMLGHGCVCNYPMFASLGLYHMPEIEKYRPAAVPASWRNQAENILAEIETAEDVFNAGTGKKIDIQRFHLINSTVNPIGSAVLFSTKDATVGYAVRKSSKPMHEAVFDFYVKRATGAPGQQRHGNAYFVCGKGNSAEDLIECQLYYGGRGSMIITGSQVERVEEKISFDRKPMYQVTVTVDCQARTVTFEVAGQKLTSRITGSVDAITHYGYGGSNSANLFTEITIR